MTSARAVAFVWYRPRAALVTHVVPGLTHAADRHARVRRFEHDEHAARGQFLLHQVGDLLRHPLLNLRLAGHRVDHAGQLAQADDSAGRDVSDVEPAREGQQVVLAEAGELDVLLQDHLFVIDFERLAQQQTRVGVQAGEHLGVQPAERGPGVSSRPSRSGSSPIDMSSSRTAARIRG